MNLSRLICGWVCLSLVLLVLNPCAQSRQIWNEDSQSYVNSAWFKPDPKIIVQPQTDQTELLWDDIHDADFDDLYGNYSECYNLMVSLGYNATQVSEGTLNSALLASYDVLVLVDEELDYSPQEVADVQDWINNGGKLLMIGENTTAFNWMSNNEILAPYNMQFVSPMIGSTGASNFNPHPITAGLSTLSWPLGSMQTYEAPAQQLAWNVQMMVTITINEQDVVVVVLNDSNMMENPYIYNDDNYLCMVNTFNYLAGGGGTPNMVIELTYLSGSPVPASGGNLYFGVFAANQETVPLDFDGWFEIAYEGGIPSTVVTRSFTNFLSGWTIIRPNMWYPIAASYAAGNYIFTGKVGEHPDVAWDESGFPFVKEGSDEVTGFIPFPVDGAPNPFEEIDVGNSPIAPSGMNLPSTYPNPFNPSTVLSYKLQDASFVHLSVYDISGRRITELVNGWRNAGNHEVTFDGSDLPSGIYIYLLEAGEFNTSGKLVLIK